MYAVLNEYIYRPTALNIQYLCFLRRFIFKLGWRVCCNIEVSGIFLSPWLPTHFILIDKSCTQEIEWNLLRNISVFFFSRSWQKVQLYFARPCIEAFGKWGFWVNSTDTAHFHTTSAFPNECQFLTKYEAKKFVPQSTTMHSTCTANTNWFLLQNTGFV